MKTKYQDQYGKTKYSLPGGRKVSWHTYRIKTGKCEICGEEMWEHPFCCRCSIMIGIGHDDATFEKNGKKYCGFCYKRIKE